mmetsp:Transcript_7801/g.8946  ORF Transcript_7801/g.8946 Transcript_7801/m.8946 type:complete len:87 (-) Transcript_7801:718-978(-)
MNQQFYFNTGVAKGFGMSKFVLETYRIQCGSLPHRNSACFLSNGTPLTYRNKYTTNAGDSIARCSIPLNVELQDKNRPHHIIISPK